jgi:hypothetical protein
MKRIKSLICMTSLVLVLAGVAQAQFDPNLLPYAANSRSLLRNSFNNMGVMGGNPELNRGGPRNEYPSNGTGAGSYGIVLAQFTSNQKSQYGNGYKTSMGEGVWVLTGDGKVSMTGPRPTSWIRDYIVPLPYDPKGKAEATWGVKNPMSGLWKGGGEEPALSNYWPGVTDLELGSYYRDQLKKDRTPPAIIANYSLGGYIKDRGVPEETLIAQWVHIKQGIQATRRIYNWSNPDFDDFYLVDMTFTNTGDFNGDGVEDNPGATPTQNSVYFAFKNSWVSSAIGVGEAYGWDGYVVPSGVDDIYFNSDASNYSGAVPSGKKISIFRDSDNPETTRDDTFDPFERAIWNPSEYILQTEGQPMAPQTMGFAPIAYADDAGDFSFNAADKGKYAQPQGDQPYGAPYWTALTKTDFTDPYAENDSESKMYGAMLQPGVPNNPNESDPSARKFYIFAQVYGPYTLAPGESAKIVVAVAVGHPAQLKNQDILTWDRSTDPVASKIQALKTQGEQALYENVELARFAYQSNYNVPASPTNVFVAADDLGSSGNAKQQISWDDSADSAVNPDKGTQDILGYRVYRSTWFGWGPWDLRDVIAKGQNGSTVNGNWTYTGGKYTYEDIDTAAGFEYHYSVRPYASGNSAWSGGGKTLADIPVGRVRDNVSKGYESGWGPPTARTYDGDERRPFQPSTAITDRLERQVRVVPNPYFRDALHEYPNSRYLRFVGVPSKCKVHIYSASGDWVYTVSHDDASKGETQFRQVTWNLSGEIMTGLYYYVVVAETPGSEGKIQRGTFVVIK